MSDGGAQRYVFGPFLDDDGGIYRGIKVLVTTVGTTNAKAYWTDEGKITAVNSGVLTDSDNDGIATAFFDGDYRFRVTQSDDSALDTAIDWDTTKVTSDTTTMWEGNVGTSYPTAAAKNIFQQFLKVDNVSTPAIAELGINMGSAFITLTDTLTDDLNDAITAIGGTNTTVVIANTFTLTSALTVPSNVQFVFKRSGKITLGNFNITFSDDSSFVAGRWQIFDENGSGTVQTLGTGVTEEIFPEWFGIDGTADDVEINRAILVAPNVGGKVTLVAGQSNYSLTDVITVTADKEIYIGSTSSNAAKLTQNTNSKNFFNIEIITGGGRGQADFTLENMFCTTVASTVYGIAIPATGGMGRLAKVSRMNFEGCDRGISILGNAIGGKFEQIDINASDTGSYGIYTDGNQDLNTTTWDKINIVATTVEAVHIEEDTAANVTAAISMRHLVIEQNQGAGLVVIGANVSLIDAYFEANGQTTGGADIDIDGVTNSVGWASVNMMGGYFAPPHASQSNVRVKFTDANSYFYSTATSWRSGDVIDVNSKVAASKVQVFGRVGSNLPTLSNQSTLIATIFDGSSLTEISNITYKRLAKHDREFDESVAGASITLDVQDSGKLMDFTNAGTVTISLPDTTGIPVGTTFRLIHQGTAGTTELSLSPVAGDMIQGVDITGSDGKNFINTAATSQIGDAIRLVSDGVAGYLVTRLIGTWARQA